MAKTRKLTELAGQLVAGSRAALGRAITLVESRRSDHRRQAQRLLQMVLAKTGGARRIGLTGVPGAGKSTLIDSFGSQLTAAGHKVAVLAVDPTSQRSGGSILGDKTRMARLSMDDNAFIRPSPAGSSLGGVARRTRETMLLCEAAGHDVVIVETVGIGQSETAVAGMVDIFIALMAPATGDELQGIKKGLLEIADVVCVNKADGDMADKARHAAADYRSALNILTAPDSVWRPRVLTVSGLTGVGLDALWQAIDEHHKALSQSGELEAKRQDQQVAWFRSLLDDEVMAAFFARSEVKALKARLEADVRAGKLTPAQAVERLMEA